MREKPRTVTKILQFMQRLDNLLKTWDPTEKRSLVAIADQTNTDVPYVLELLFGGRYDFDVYEPLPYKSVEKAYYLLQQRMRPEIEFQEKQKKTIKEKVLQLYEQVKNKISDLMQDGNYRVAYKSLNYFYGLYANYLEDHLKLEIYSELLKIGTKIDLNFQEFAEWIQKGTQIIFKTLPYDICCIEKYYKFVGPYVGYLLKRFPDKTPKFFKTLLNNIEKSTEAFNIYYQFEELFLKSENFNLYISENQNLQI